LALVITLAANGRSSGIVDRTPTLAPMLFWIAGPIFDLDQG